MKQLNLAAALIFGLAVPALTQAIAPTIVHAEVKDLNDVFADKEWNVSIYHQNNSYHYRGYNVRTKSSIELSGATVTRDGERKIYTWNNGGTRYRVTWQPKDPSYIRVRVMTPNGKEVLNRLLSLEEGGC